MLIRQINKLHSLSAGYKHIKYKTMYKMDLLKKRCEVYVNALLTGKKSATYPFHKTISISGVYEIVKINRIVLFVFSNC